MATLELTYIVNGATIDVSTFNLSDCPTCPEHTSAETLFEEKRRAHQAAGWAITNQGAKQFRARQTGRRTGRVRERVFRLKG